MMDQPVTYNGVNARESTLLARGTEQKGRAQGCYLHFTVNKRKLDRLYDCIYGSKFKGTSASVMSAISRLAASASLRRQLKVSILRITEAI